MEDYPTSSPLRGQMSGREMVHHPSPGVEDRAGYWFLQRTATWNLAGMNFCTNYIISSFIAMLSMFLNLDVGLDLAVTGAYNSVVFAASIAAKVLFGVAADHPRFGNTFSMCGLLLSVFGTLAVFRWPYSSGDGWSLEPTTNHFQLLTFAVIYGLGYGASFTISNSMPAKLFGHERGYCKLQSFLAAVAYMGSFIGVFLTGQLRDAFGSYGVAFAVYPLMASIVCVNFAFLVRGQRQQLQQRRSSS